MNKIYKLAILASIFILAVCCKRTGVIDKDNLIGAWAPSLEENVVFTITNQNIKYFEDDFLYSYKIEKNKFSLIESGHIIASYEIILLTRDSLIWKAEEGNILQLVKRK
jgi:hypothetical protein